MLKSMAFENHSAASAYLGGLALNSSKAFCLQLLNSALTASPDAASFGASSVRGGGGASASSSSSLSFFCWRAHQTSAAMPTPAAAATAKACVCHVDFESVGWRARGRREHTLVAGLGIGPSASPSPPALRCGAPRPPAPIDSVGFGEDATEPS